MEEKIVTKFSWEITTKQINLSNILHRVNADKLFVSLLLNIEKNEIDFSRVFTINEISQLIPFGSGGIVKKDTYGFSMISMLSAQNNRDYFIFNNPQVKDSLTELAKSKVRNNFYWKKHYLHEKLRINPKYYTE